MSESKGTPNKDSSDSTLFNNGLNEASKSRENEVSISKDHIDSLTTQEEKILTNESDDDAWDDRILMKSYQKSVKMVDAALKKKKSEKKVTSKKVSGEGLSALKGVKPKKESFCPADHQVNYHHEIKNVDKDKLKYLRYNNESVIKTYRFNAAPGKYCRSTFSEDGKDYEAVILQVYPEESVLLRYIGYENEEVRPISLLKDSAGEQARIKQTQMAKEELGQDEALIHEANDTEEGEDPSIEQQDPLKQEKSAKASNPTKRSSSGRIQDQTEQSTSGPTFSLPCPPPILSSFGGNEDDEALASMLMSWYMSGYHTGYYQAMKKYRK
jgi:survival motor neuron protein